MRYIADHPTKDAKMIRGRNKARRILLALITTALVVLPTAQAAAMHARHPH